MKYKKLIIWTCLMIIGIVTISILSEKGEKTIIITDCYDEYYNKIIGLSCEKQWNSNNLYIGLTGLYIFFVVIIGGLFGFRYLMGEEDKKKK